MAICVRCGNSFKPFVTMSGHVQKFQCSPCGEQGLRNAFKRIEESDRRWDADYGPGGRIDRMMQGVGRRRKT